MKVEVHFFGQLTDKAGVSVVQIDHPGSLSQLKHILLNQYPSLHDAKFIIAINNKVVTEEVTIPDDCIIALMPPFSGG